MAKYSDNAEQLVLLEDLDDFRQYAKQIAASTRRRLTLFARHLDPLIYAQKDFIETLSSVARQNRDGQIRILITDYRVLTEQNPALLKLIRRLPSRFQVKVLSLDDDTDPLLQQMSVMMVDRSALLYQNQEKTYQGFANFSAGPELERFLEPVEHYWNNACIDKNLSQLNL